MVLLDTNHMDALMVDHPRRAVLLDRLNAYEHGVATTIISMQEKVEGWLKKINDNRVPPMNQVRYYALFAGIFRHYSVWRVATFDEPAAREFVRLKTLRLKGPGTNDLKIAAIALCHGATVLTTDINHFGRIEGLDVQDWLLDDPSDEPPVQ